MSQPARKNAVIEPHVESGSGPSAPRASKTSVYLVTLDESLWPQIGPKLDKSCVLKQLDSVEELQGSVPAGQAGVVIFDAREAQDAAGQLSGLQMHSAAFAIVVLDAPERQDRWRPARRQQQIVAALPVPFADAEFLESLSNASEECKARSVMLAQGGASAPSVPPTGRRNPWTALWVLGVLAGCGAAYLVYRLGATPTTPSPAPPPAAAAAAPGAAPGAAPASPAAAGTADLSSGNDEKVDALLERARQAMLDRRYLDPASNNALSLYQSVLTYDADNGEAHQGLQRLEQILIARVQSYLDDKKYDLALQFLETARSLNPTDPKLPELDARVTTLRAELGSTQIQAAINANSYDRASELIEEAARAKTLSVSRLAQLREEVRRHRAESDSEGVLSLLTLRLQQDKLLDPPSDSAVYYFKQARLAGASPADLEASGQELGRKLVQGARTALDDHRPGDAERLLDEAQKIGASAKLIASVRSDLAAQQGAPAREKIQRPQNIDLAQSRLAQGQLLEPANDSALYYLNQVRAVDPSNAQLGPLTAALQSAILARARTALDGGDAAAAKALAATANALGPSPELDALRDRLARPAPSSQAASTGAGTPAGTPAGAAAGTVAGNAGKLAVTIDKLTAERPLRPEYPHEALVNGTEGWVDLAFTVTVEGKVANVSVVKSSPRYVFDSAAKSALGRVLYRPVMVDGHPVEVTSSLHVVFKLAKQ